MVHLTAEGLPGFLREHPDATLLDVRPSQQRRGRLATDSLHLPWYGDDWVPNPDFLARARALLDPSSPVLVMCQRGLDSPAAAAMLEADGFRRVYNLIGGCEDLRASRCAPSRPQGSISFLEVEEDHARD